MSLRKKYSVERHAFVCKGSYSQRQLCDDW